MLLLIKSALLTLLILSAVSPTFAEPPVFKQVHFDSFFSP
jgi:hypothetical protein